MYSDVVLGIDHYHFEELLEAKKMPIAASSWIPRSPPTILKIAGEASIRRRSSRKAGKPFPQDVQEQLWGAIMAVFDSWMNARAITYRRLHDIPESWGTAVNVQSMVFGNMGDDCATGVAFTRNPSTGEKAFYGEFLVNAQGEDVVAGIRTPQPLTIKGKATSGGDLPSMEEVMPDVFANWSRFTRSSKPLPRHAGYRIHRAEPQAVDAADALGKRTAGGQRQDRGRYGGRKTHHQGSRPSSASTRRRSTSCCTRRSTRNAKKTVLARGLPASPGAAAASSSSPPKKPKRARIIRKKSFSCASKPRRKIFTACMRRKGILTARGGMTSHAAVVARGMGKPCVSGAGDIKIDYAAKTFKAGGQTVKEGDFVTINGSTGEVFLGEVPTVQPQLSGDFATLMGWADELRTLKIRTNAETPLDATTARKFGAEGIGLCRTEHMFFDTDRIIAMREMIVSDTVEKRKAALAKLLPMQRKDFAEIFRIMAGLPVTIRLLDPPLHEFLPHTDAEIKEVAKAAGVTVEYVKMRAHALHESNPMLGHRGCRLGVTYPEIYEMQARAIFEAASEVNKKDKGKSHARNHDPAGDERERTGA